MYNNMQEGIKNTAQDNVVANIVAQKEIGLNISQDVMQNAVPNALMQNSMQDAVSNAVQNNARKLFVGVDLHKTQFTICVLDEKDNAFEEGTKFSTTKAGYDAFAERINQLASQKLCASSSRKSSINTSANNVSSSRASASSASLCSTSSSSASLCSTNPSYASKSKSSSNTSKSKNSLASLDMNSNINAHMPVSIAIESTSNARYFRDIMKEKGFEVTVVNTLRFKVVNLSTKKTDKNDARTLAEFLARDILPKSHLCTPESESLRRILKSRSLMVQDAVALKNQAHAIMLAYGYITLPSQFQSRSSRTKLLTKIPAKVQEVIEIIFETLDIVENQVRVLERRLKKITADNDNINLLMTIPGIGIVNACTIYSYIDDIERFENYKNFSAYCGLVPWVQTSNETVYYGKITKRGPQELRTALVQCVVAMVRMPVKTSQMGIIKQYHKLKDEKSSGKAIIATARKLSRIIYIMLKTKTPFDFAKLTKDTAGDIF